MFFRLDRIGGVVGEVCPGHGWHHIHMIMSTMYLNISLLSIILKLHMRLVCEKESLPLVFVEYSIPHHQSVPCPSLLAGNGPPRSPAGPHHLVMT